MQRGTNDVWGSEHYEHSWVLLGLGGTIAAGGWTVPQHDCGSCDVLATSNLLLVKRNVSQQAYAQLLSARPRVQAFTPATPTSKSTVMHISVTIYAQMHHFALSFQTLRSLSRVGHLSYCATHESGTSSSPRHRRAELTDSSGDTACTKEKSTCKIEECTTTRDGMMKLLGGKSPLYVWEEKQIMIFIPEGYFAVRTNASRFRVVRDFLWSGRWALFPDGVDMMSAAMKWICSWPSRCFGNSHQLK